VWSIRIRHVASEVSLHIVQVDTSADKPVPEATRDGLSRRKALPPAYPAIGAINARDDAQNARNCVPLALLAALVINVSYVLVLRPADLRLCSVYVREYLVSVVEIDLIVLCVRN
jgi:hypothetical protein